MKTNIAAKSRAWLCAVLCLCALPTQGSDETGIHWRSWDGSSFAVASDQGKPVFLYLEAVWCHWCHVMQDQSFSDPRVIERLNRDFVPVRVDHDAMPGLANRYRDYGWPALIWLDAEGNDLVKRAGYISPDSFLRLLDAITADPTPESASITAALPKRPPVLSEAARNYLLARHDYSFDPELGGLKTQQKFMDRDSMEYALRHLDKPGEKLKLTRTLDAAAALIDPVWGGVYQYSTGGDWQHPHYEKVMRVQAGYLRMYAMAFAALGRAEDREAAENIIRYLLDMLRSPEGIFYPSQDADLVQGEKAHAYFALDDAARRARGMPRIDTSLYADVNGMAAEALAVYAMATGDARTARAAEQAHDWVMDHRRAANGLMRHGQTSDDVFHLSDSLHVARAALRLYELTAQRDYLLQAKELASAIQVSFAQADMGLSSATAVPGVPVAPKPHLPENITAARFLNRLFHYTGDERLRQTAELAMRLLSAHAEQQEDFQEIGIVLAEEELRSEPPHLTVVGSKSDPMARALFATAQLASPPTYRRIEWWDPSEGPLPHHDVQFPELESAAGFVCAEGRCSRPSLSPETYARQIGRLLAR